MTGDELELHISAAADYLIQKQAIDAELDGRDLEEGQEQTLRDEVKLKLEAAAKKAQELQEALRPLVMQARDIPFRGMEEQIMESWRCALNSWLSCTLALSDTLPKPRTRALHYHQAAARLAVALESGPSARDVTKRIIEKAKLKNDYSEQSLDNWLREARKDPMNRDPK